MPPDALKNLKELIRSMEEFDSLPSFLEHIALVMDRDSAEDNDAVSIMTLHSAKGLEFDTVFLPGWEEGLFRTSVRWMRRAPRGWRKNAALPMSASPAPRSGPRSMSPPTGASMACGKIPFPPASLTNCPTSMLRSRKASPPMAAMVPPASAARSMAAAALTAPTRLKTPMRPRVGNGHRRAAPRKDTSPRAKRTAPVIDGELVAKSVSDSPSKYSIGERVFHIKFGYGEIRSIEGNKLTIQFQTGQKRVLDSFVEKH